ncbi:MAG: DUF485 domain-containing protein [Planctomycetota bacterium]
MQHSFSRAGLALFAVYLVLYAGFVLLNAFWPERTEATPVAGLNVAILYGFGLMVAAIVLALIYGFVSRGGSDSTRTEDGEADR